MTVDFYLFYKYIDGRLNILATIKYKQEKALEIY